MTFDDAARRDAKDSGRHPAGRHIPNPRPAPGCLACGCETEPGSRRLPGFHHSCARSLPTRLTLGADYRKLIELDGKPYSRALHAHEVADFTLQEVDLNGDEARDLTGACAEIQLTEDRGMRRRYLTADGEKLQNWMVVTGAHARKWLEISEAPREVVVAEGRESVASRGASKVHFSRSQVVSVLRPRNGRLRITMPYSPWNRAWLKEICGARTRPLWTGKHWEVARVHFRAVAEALAEKFGEADAYLDVVTRTLCTDACRDARGTECDCVCEGRNHQGLEFMLRWLDLGSVLIGTDVRRVHRRVVRGGAA